MRKLDTPKIDDGWALYELRSWSCIGNQEIVEIDFCGEREHWEIPRFLE